MVNLEGSASATISEAGNEDEEEVVEDEKVEEQEKVELATGVGACVFVVESGSVCVATSEVHPSNSPMKNVADASSADWPEFLE